MYSPKNTPTPASQTFIFFHGAFVSTTTPCLQTNSYSLATTRKDLVHSAYKVGMG
jgi:hypothetical protein